LTARASGARKRGGDDDKLPLDDNLIVSSERAAELVALDEALNALAAFDE
jgi:hypothetical protein